MHLPDAAATERLGGAIGSALEPGLHIYLRGEIGSGKTTLVRALLHAAGVVGRVKSPSYALVELYVVSRLHLYHFDFYRFRDSTEWRDAGFEEYFGGDGVCLVEWPERAGDKLPRGDLDIALGPAKTGRNARIDAHSEAGVRCLKSVSESKSHKGFS